MFIVHSFCGSNLVGKVLSEAGTSVTLYANQLSTIEITSNVICESTTGAPDSVVMIGAHLGKISSFALLFFLKILFFFSLSGAKHPSNPPDSVPEGPGLNDNVRYLTSMSCFVFVVLFFSLLSFLFPDISALLRCCCFMVQGSGSSMVLEIGWPLAFHFPFPPPPSLRLPFLLSLFSHPVFQDRFAHPKQGPLRLVGSRGDRPLGIKALRSRPSPKRP